MSEKYNEQGIKVCCENCEWWGKTKCAGMFRKPCIDGEYFMPSAQAYDARIAELTAFIEDLTQEDNSNPQYPQITSKYERKIWQLHQDKCVLLRREEGK